MKFVLPVPVSQLLPGRDMRPGVALRAIAQAMEAAGVGAVCLSEHPAPSATWLQSDPTGHDTLDPFAGLAFAAAATQRIKIFTNVVVLPFRNPFLTAKAAATLQLLSNDRLIMGVGVGYQKEEFSALGVDYAARGALTDEALETIRLIWQGGSVVKRGKNFDAAGNEPRPLPRPAPPIWIGGSSDRAVARAALWGDGWMPYFSVPTNDPTVRRSSIVSIEDFAEKRDRLMELRARAGRTGPYEIAVGAPFRPKQLDASDAERFLADARRLAEQGVDWIWTPLPAPSQAGFLEHVAWFGDEIIARF